MHKYYVKGNQCAQLTFQVSAKAQYLSLINRLTDNCQLGGKEIIVGSNVI